MSGSNSWAGIIPALHGEGRIEISRSARTGEERLVQWGFLARRHSSSLRDDDPETVSAPESIRFQAAAVDAIRLHPIA